MYTISLNNKVIIFGDNSEIKPTQQLPNSIFFELNTNDYIEVFIKNTTAVNAIRVNYYNLIIK